MATAATPASRAFGTVPARVSGWLLALLATAACGGGGGTEASSPEPVASVTITGGDTLFGVGESRQFAAELRDAAGQKLTGRTVTWSGGGAVATVQANGLVLGVALGSATVIATSEGVQGSFAFRVKVGAVASIEVLPAAASVAMGDTARFTATLRDAGGNVVPGAVPSWSTPDTTLQGAPTSMVVDGTGRVQALRRSVTPRVLTATYGAVSGSAAVTITAGTLGGTLRLERGGGAGQVLEDDIYTFPAGADFLVATPPVTRHTFDGSSRTENSAWSPDGAWIAFDGAPPFLASDLFLLPATGGTPVKVLPPSGHYANPLWTPDGSRLVIALTPPSARPIPRQRLYLMNPDGSGAVQLVDSLFGGRAAWGATGTLTFFDTLGTLVTVDTNGGAPAPSPIASPTGGSIIALVFSPDRSRVAFQDASPGGTTFDLWVASATGTGAVKVLPNVYGPMEWSPDGTRLAVTVPNPAEAPGYRQFVKVVDADGSNVRDLTLAPIGVWFLRAYDQFRQMAWSPDGERVAFSACLVRTGVPAPLNEDLCGVYSVARDGTRPVGFVLRGGGSVRGWVP